MSESRCKYLRVRKHYTIDDTLHCVFGNNPGIVKCYNHRYDCKDRRLIHYVRKV